jgi:hypothetical protein
MSSLVEFLRARLDEDEQAAGEWHRHDCPGHTEHSWGYEWHPEYCDCGIPARVIAEVEAKRAILAHHRTSTFTDVSLGIQGWTVCVICHFVMDEPDDWDDTKDWPYPFVQYPFPCPTLRLLAQPYAGHPDFDPAWRTG